MVIHHLRTRAITVERFANRPYQTIPQILGSDTIPIMLTKYLVTTEVDEDGFVVASCPSLPGCHTQGRTLEEALENIKDAIEVYVEYTNEQAGKVNGTEPQRRIVEVSVTT